MPFSRILNTAHFTALIIRMSQNTFTISINQDKPHRENPVALILQRPSEEGRLAFRRKGMTAPATERKRYKCKGGENNFLLLSKKVKLKSWQKQGKPLTLQPANKSKQRFFNYIT